jgi:protein SCO1/2
VKLPLQVSIVAKVSAHPAAARQRLNRSSRFKSALIAFSLVLAAVALAGCATDSPKLSCCAKPEIPIPFTDKSIYQVDSMWTTDQSKQIKLSQLSGRPQVIAMFFANCQYACPVIVNDMKRIEAALTPELRARIGFTLVSFDTLRDTPTALAEYRRVRNLPLDRWVLLQGQPDDVLELAALLGIKFKQDSKGQFAHSNLITILNTQGEILHQQIGLNQDIGETVRLLQQLAAKESPHERETND